jgi:hypothetical protein
VANSEYAGRGPGTLGGGNTEHNLPGFSSNAKWDQLQEGGLWSHLPVQPGPKAGFHDPIEANPVRSQLWEGSNQSGADDDAPPGGKF